MIKFINYPQQLEDNSTLHHNNLNVEFHRSCILTPRKMNWPEFSYTGCAYNCHGDIIELSKRPSSYAAYKPADPNHINVLNNSDFIDGLSIYLGNWFPHFGHFLLDTLARAWLPRSLISACDHIIFHPWDENQTTSLDWDVAESCCSALGISISKIVIVPKNGLRVEKCIFPESATRINEGINIEFVRILDRINIEIKIDSPIKQHAKHHGIRIYFTRKNQYRRASNEDIIEQIFSNLGFIIIAPETLPFSKQVAIASEADIIAGCDGSAMHLAAFSKKAAIITLDQRAVPNQFAIEKLKKLPAYHIWATRNHDNIAAPEWIADEDIIYRHLNDVISEIDRARRLPD